MNPELHKAQGRKGVGSFGSGEGCRIVDEGISVGRGTDDKGIGRRQSYFYQKLSWRLAPPLDVPARQKKGVYLHNFSTDPSRK